MKTIFSKFFVGFALIVSLFAALIFYFSFDLIRDSYVQSLVQNLHTLDNSITHIIKPNLQKGDFNQMDSVVKSLNKELKYRITIIDKNGVVLADSKSDPKKMENHIDRPEVTKALLQGKGSSIRYSYTLHKNLLYVASPITLSNNNVTAVTRISVNLDEVDSLILNLRNKLLQLFLIMLALSLLFAYLLSRNLTRPIDRITDYTKRIAEGDFSKKIKYSRKDELGVLSENVNVMMEKLSSGFGELQSKNEALDAILGSIEEALVVTDETGRIYMNNESFANIAGNTNPAGMQVWELIHNETVYKLFKRIKRSESGHKRELEYRGQHYVCSITKLKNLNDYVFVFYNITHIKKVENMKKDFVMNVSHELRTPLTVIKGYIETLSEDETVNERRNYLNVMQRHTDRLINIVQDLLTIAEIEDIKKNPLETSPIKVQDIFKYLETSFTKKVQEKKLTLNMQIDEGADEFMGDNFKIEQMFINLIDNAIKYTDKGNIEVCASKKETSILFTIADTGIGIPEKDLHRVFERFYTVDKSHSRQNGGTGLGLTIAKHIALLHKGKINVQSKVGLGTVFSVELPV